MGAAAFDAAGRSTMEVAGLASISLEEYAMCLGRQLGTMRGVGASVQLTHCSDVRSLLQDLAEASQPRFAELAGVVEHTPSRVSPADTITATGMGGTLVQSMTALAPSQRRAHVETAVLRVIYELTGAADVSLTAETPLMEAGVDSLAATELSSRLRSLTGVALSPTIVFEQPTPRAIAAHLLEHAGGGAGTSVSACLAFVGADSRLGVAAPVGQWPGGCDGELARRLLQVACGNAPWGACPPVGGYSKPPLM